jgi:hypothetical protein
MRVLYLYPEEWTGLRAREVQTLSTCVALAERGVDVTLVTGGGEAELRNHLLDVADSPDVLGLEIEVLSRTLGPVQSTSIFSRNFLHWIKSRRPFDLAYIVHLKAGAILAQAGIPYAYEAHSILAQSPQNPARQRELHKLEQQVLNSATILLATSIPLASALRTWYNLSKDFSIAPNAGMPPLSKGLSVETGPFVYCGSIGESRHLVDMMQAAYETNTPLKMIGGTEQEWDVLCGLVHMNGVEWQPRVRLTEVQNVLAGARAGLIPTNFDLPTGEFSCPMKLFDYARCGLPVLSTALPALQSLDVGDWCTQVPSPARGAWVEILKAYHYDAAQAEAAREWSTGHTWAQRAEMLKQAFGA